MNRILLLLAFAAACLATAQAQTNCYQKVRSDGLDSLNRGRYGGAINQFWAAFECLDKPANHDLESLIKKAQKSWTNDLEKRADTERRAKEQIETQRKQLAETNVELEKARQKAEDNEKIALQNAEMARQQGKKAESLRLVMLADNARRQGRKSESVLLAYLALQSAGQEVSPTMMRAFGEAVRDSMKREVFSNSEKISQLQALPGDRNKLLLQLDNHSALLLDLETGEQQRLSQPSEFAGSLAASPDGQFFLNFSDKKIELTGADGRRIATAQAHAEGIRDVVFSPDGQRVITCGRDNVARFWDARNGQAAGIAEGHGGNVYAADFSPDGSLALTRGSDGRVLVWNAAGQKTAEIADGTGYCYDARFVAGGAKIATAGADGALRFWTPDGRLLDSVRCSGRPLAQVFSLKKSNRVAALASDGGAVLCNSENRSRVWLSKNSPVEGIEVNADGSLLATRHRDHSVRLWSAEGALLRTFVGHGGPVARVVFSPSGEYLLSTSEDGMAKLWSATAGTLLLDWPIQNAVLVPAVFSPDGQSIVLVEQRNQSLTTLSLPDLVLKKMRESNYPPTALVERVKNEYDLQFLGGGKF